MSSGITAGGLCRLFPLPSYLSRISDLLPLPTGRRLGLLLIGYLALVVGAITLAPFQFAVPASYHASWMVLDEGWVSDLLLNVVLFLPLGFLLRRTSSAIGGVRRVLLTGVLLSAAIEIAQLFLEPRFSSVSDVLANSLGAGAGALLSDAVGRRLGQGRTLIGHLLLDLPLMGFVYLLVPVMWLDGLASAGAPSRLWSMVPLVSGGVLALAAVAASGAATVWSDDEHRHAFSAGLGLSALLWYFLGAVPALRVAPWGIVVGAVLVVLGTPVARRLWRGAVRHDRRLEPQVVRLLLPLVLLYLTQLALNGTASPAAGRGEVARVGLLRGLERGVGFTLLGYLVAEWRGRREEPLPRTLLAPVVVAALVIGVLARFAGGPANGTAVMVAMAATAFGALLYAFQRAHILALLGRAEAPQS